MGAIADAIVAYAQPLMDGTDGSLEDLNKALALSQVCWNVALLPEEDRAAALDDMRRDFPFTEDEFDDFKRSVLTPMIRRHERMFPRLHGREPLEAPHWGLPPATRRPPSPEAQTPPVGRYDPCPCNSGKKYKFCCGRARR